MQNRLLPVAAPVLAGREMQYVAECLESTWISSSGKYIDAFEQGFADFCGVQHAVSCCNGTVALHLALLALGVGPGDEVIVPTLTYIATANAVSYCGASPVFVDSEPQAWNLNPELIEEHITPRTKGIIVVHLYGHPVDMDPVLSLARRHGLFVVEDAAEAHGAEYKGRKVGSIGDIGTFSFYGNKIITTGEGGMVVTQDGSIAARVRQLKGQGMDTRRRYWFPVIGFNYRMTNLAAAIGLAQLEKIGWHMERRREVASWYLADLRALPGVTWQKGSQGTNPVWWMFTVVLDDDLEDRDKIMRDLTGRGVETRPIFYPVHTLPPYESGSRGQSFPVAEHIARRGINLPTWAGLAREDVRYVSESLRRCLREVERV